MYHSHPPHPHTHEHVDGVVGEVLTRLSKSLLIFIPVPLEKWILHEHEGPTYPRQELGYILHDGLGALSGCEREGVCV